MNLTLLLVFLVIAGRTLAISCDRQLLPELWFRLNGNDLDWPDASTLSIHESSGRYVPRNVIVTRVQIYKDQAYLAMPRYRPGVPFGLGVASIKPKSNVNVPTVLRAFPNLVTHEEGNCNALQSVVDVVVDDQSGVLWALDIGIVNSLERPVRRCSPKILAFELKGKSKNITKMIDLSPFVDDYSRLQQLIVERASDNQIYLYISDAATRNIIVYNASNDTGFNVQLPRVVSEDNSLKDVLYLALIKGIGKDKPNNLYFTYLGSSRIYKIRTDKLRTGQVKGFILEAGRKTEKIAVLGTDNGSALFFRNKGQSDVYIWNTELDFKSENVLLVQKGNECRLPTHVVPGSKKLMWLVESNFQDYIANTVNNAGASVVLHPIVKSSED